MKTSMRWLYRGVVGLCASSLGVACVDDTKPPEDVTETGYDQPLEGSKRYELWADFVEGLPTASPEDFEAACNEDVSSTYSEVAEYFGCLLGPQSGEAELQERTADNFEEATFSFYLGSTQATDECAWIGNDMMLEQDELSLGLAGANYGHFVSLGTEANYAAITWDAVNAGALLGDEELAALLYRIDDPDPVHLTSTISPEVGGVYVIHYATVDREEFVKLRVLEATEAGYRFEWEVLERTATADLCAARADGYRDWYENERGLASGRVTLYDRSDWGDYYKATFNSAFATRDHVYLTNNNWDIFFQQDELSGFDWHEDADSGPTVARLEGVALADVTLEDADTATFEAAITPEVGAVYYVRSYVYGYKAETAIHIVEVQPDSVTLDWRRLSATLPE